VAEIHLCGRKNRTVCVAAKLTLLEAEIGQKTHLAANTGLLLIPRLKKKQNT
jgi:hypothetical protein